MVTAIASLTQLASQSPGRCRFLFGKALSINISTACGGRVENMVSRLYEPGKLKLTPKLSGADQAGALIDDSAPFAHIAILEQKKCFGIRPASQKTLKRFQSRLLAKATNGAAFLKSALLIYAYVGRDDADAFKVFVDPLNDLISPWGAMNTRRFNLDSVRDADRQAGPKQNVQRSCKHESEQGRSVGDDQAERSASHECAAVRASRMMARPLWRAATFGPSMGAIGWRRPSSPSPPNTCT